MLRRAMPSGLSGGRERSLAIFRTQNAGMLIQVQPAPLAAAAQLGFLQRSVTSPPRPNGQHGCTHCSAPLDGYQR